MSQHLVALLRDLLELVLRAEQPVLQLREVRHLSFHSSLHRPLPSQLREVRHLSPRCFSLRNWRSVPVLPAG